MFKNDLTCPTHSCVCVAFCSNSSCAVKLACSKCILFKHNECQNYLIFFEDIQKENTTELLLNDNFEQIFKEEDLKAILLGENTTFKQMIEELTSNFIDKAEQFAIEIRDKLLQEFGDSEFPADSSEKLKKIIEMQKIKEIISKDSFEKAEEALLSLKIISNGRAIKNQMANFKKNISAVINKISLTERIRNTLDNCLKQAKDEINYKITDPDACQFDPERTNNNLKINAELNSIVKTGEDFSPKGALLSLEIKPRSAKYNWKFKLTNINSDPNYPNYLVAFGLIPQEYWDTDLNYFNYTGFSCFDTSSAIYGSLSIVSGAQSAFEGVTVEFTYNAKKGSLQIKCSNGLSLSGALDTRSIYKPFVMVYKNGNTVSIIE